jgi:iron(III) transport system permease protein
VRQKSFKLQARYEPAILTGAKGYRRGRGIPGKPPLFLALIAALSSGAILLPLTYLIIRTAGLSGAALWSLIANIRTLEVLLNSAGLAIAVFCCSALIAVPLAFLTMRTDLPGQRFWLIGTILPLAVPDYVACFALISAFGPRGSLFQLALEPFGVESLPEIYGWFGAILSITLVTYPYLLLSIWAGLQRLDPELENAARSLGYNRWSTFFRVTLPQLRLSLVTGGLIVAMYALQDFSATTLMRFDAFTRVIFLQYRYTFDRHRAAALALLLVGLMLLILWLEYRVRSRSTDYSRSNRVTAPQSLIPLGIWKIPALLFCLIVVSLGLLLPIGVTLFWLIRGLMAGELSEITSLLKLAELAGHSILAAALAAGFTTLFALPISILVVWFPSPITMAIERCSYLGFGLPGIVVALSLVFWGANYVPYLYQTLPMLILAYLVMFLPQSVGNVRSSLLQVNPHLEESARSLGKTPWQTLKRVTLPLVRPGLISGAVLIFLTAIKELPATLLLAPIGFNTLAVHIWKATEDVAYTAAAAAALVMLVVSISATLLVLTHTSLNELTSEVQRWHEAD